MDGVTTITITHPFHPFKGKEYEYLGQANGYVRCLDEQGKIRLFPVRYTNLYTSIVDKRSSEDDCILSFDDFLMLKELLDAILSKQNV